MRDLCHSNPQRYLRAYATLSHACAYLEDQYLPRLSRVDAVNHFQSRTLLLRHRFHLHNEMVKRFPELQGEPITQAEIDSAVQQAHEHRTTQQVA